MSRRFRVLAVLAVSVACGALAFTSKATGTEAAARLPAARALSPAAATAPVSQPFGGTSAVGALFTVSSGGPGTHFCTASVVHSSHGDLAVTAAHCVTGKQGQIVFVPGYVNGKEPHGAWTVTAVFTSAAWQASQDPDDDVAFLRLSDGPGGISVENAVGAVRLGTSQPQPAPVQVIGYPGDTDQPVSCTSWTKVFSPTQLEFDCGGYPDGTSGGPFLTTAGGASDGASGQSTVIAVIGGYEQGGDTPDVSYAAAFGSSVAALYASAETAG